MKKTAERPSKLDPPKHQARRAAREKHRAMPAAVAKRSVENILQWNSYLPVDCVRAMVRMGWDYTT